MSYLHICFSSRLVDTSDVYERKSSWFTKIARGVSLVRAERQVLRLVPSIKQALQSTPCVYPILQSRVFALQIT